MFPSEHLTSWMHEGAVLFRGATYFMSGLTGFTGFWGTGVFNTEAQNTEAQRNGGRLGRGLARPVVARSLAAFHA